MKHVLQNIRATQTGDCLNACIASILEMKLEDIPSFNLIQDNDGWWNSVQEWAKSIGFQLLYLPLNEYTTIFPMLADIYCILIGPTENGNPHAVVGYCRGGKRVLDFMIIHDPFDKDGIEKVDAILFLVPIKPERVHVLLQRHKPKFRIVEYWPNFVDRSEEPRFQIVDDLSEVGEIPWIKEKGSVEVKDRLVMRERLIVAQIFDEEK
jgi:hypothetical protein